MSRLILVFLVLWLLVGCSPAGETMPTVDSENISVIWPAAHESVDAQPVLQWDAFPEASQYQVIIINTDTKEPVFSEKTTERQMPVIMPLPEGQNYTWTVQALDERDEVIGEVHSFFRVKDGLTAVWPNNGESVDNKPILQWDAYPSAAEYHLIVVDDDAYPPVVAFDQTTTETMLEVTPELDPGSYSWTVQAKDPNGIIVAEANNQFVVEP